MQYMRRVSLGALYRVFRRGDRVLEIGCGTGEEAIALAHRGIEVLATDISQQMVAIAERKIKCAGLDHLIRVRQMAALELDQLVETSDEGAFQGAYSSFGALNGEPDLEGFGKALAVLLAPGGRLVVSIMNRYYPFEVFWYLAHARPGRALRRWGGSARSTVSPNLAVTVPTWYYTPRGFQHSLGSAFRRVSCRALPLLLPPPFAAHLWHRFPLLIRALCRWEGLLAARWPWSALGDHFLMVLERTWAKG
jgi:SAM-dependent methyltransferase